MKIPKPTLPSSQSSVAGPFGVDIPEPVILVIDDEMLIRTCLVEVLSDYQLLTAPSGVRAVEMLRSHPNPRVDLAIIDYTMPIWNGAQTLRHLRSICPNIKSILVSGAMAAQLEPIVLTHHFDAWLSKPFLNETILALVRSLLAGERIEETRALEAPIHL